MKIAIDTETGRLQISEPAVREIPLYSPEAFHELSRLWLKVGWSLKYTYSFSWLGRPVIQMPEDLVRIQEVLYAAAPDLVIETGVAHGGSLVFYASLFKVMGRGRVVGVDVEIRPHNRKALEEHPLKPLITLIEGDSVAAETVARVRAQMRPDDRVLVVLDSNHAKAHVLAELRAYAPLVSPGSYLVVADGIMEDLHDVPRGQPEWRTDNPLSAIDEFLATQPEFQQADPALPFNESPLHERLTYWPRGYLLRRRG